MGLTSWWHWVIILVVVLVLFGGKGKISSLMGDFGKGLKSFKKNIKDEADSTSTAADDEDQKQINAAASSADSNAQDKAAKS